MRKVALVGFGSKTIKTDWPDDVEIWTINCACGQLGVEWGCGCSPGCGSGCNVHPCGEWIQQCDDQRGDPGGDRWHAYPNY